MMVSKIVTFAILCSTSISGTGLGDGNPTNTSKGAPFRELADNEISYTGIVTYANRQEQIKVSQLCFEYGKPEIQRVKRNPPGVASTLELGRIGSIKKLGMHQDKGLPGSPGSGSYYVLVEVTFANDGSKEERLIPHKTIVSGVEPTGEKSAAYMKDVNEISNIKLSPIQGKSINPKRLLPRALDQAISVGKNVFGKMKTACSSAVTILKKS
ncbi:hypothetical protein HOD08_00210 [bacterium]|nr:hypothetical protein [bacterium]